jgi:hypothetical protein
VKDLSDDRRNEVAFHAASALATMGEVRAARDAWLSYEWPLRHHGTPISLHELGHHLLRHLPDLAEHSTDPDDLDRTIRALETLKPESPDPLERVVIRGSPSQRERRRAAEALRRWRRPAPDEPAGAFNGGTGSFSASTR